MNLKNALLIVLMSVLIVFAGLVTGSARKSTTANVLSAVSAEHP